jgi:DNA mismatch repair ATPase MutL
MDEIVALVVIEEDASAEDDRTPEEIRSQEDRSWRFKQILDKKISLSEQSDFIHKLTYNKLKKGQEESTGDFGKAIAKKPKEETKKKAAAAKEESEEEKEEFSEEEEESEGSEESEEDIKAKSKGKNKDDTKSKKAKK